MRTLIWSAVLVALFIAAPVYALNETEGERYYYDECGNPIGEDYWFCGTAGVQHYGEYSDIYREFIWESCAFQPITCADVGLSDRCGWCVTPGYLNSIEMGFPVLDPCGV